MSTQYQKAEADRDNDGLRVGAWDASLFGCLTFCMPNCCMSWLFPCVSLAQISSRIGLYRFSFVFLVFFLLYIATVSLSTISIYFVFHGTKETIKTVFADENDPTVDTRLDKAGKKIDNGSKLNDVSRVLSSISALLYLLLIWRLRSKVRARFQIPGNCCFDFVSASFCSCCAIAQMATHVKSYKPGSCNFGPPDTLPAYQ